ncbi:hypothetical protein BS78_02G146700 [Paspalum vaginatum]|nr:hypothetical protein BS78_02G146700 [Paspalum vaginatum]
MLFPLCHQIVPSSSDMNETWPGDGSSLTMKQPRPHPITDPESRQGIPMIGVILIVALHQLLRMEQPVTDFLKEDIAIRQLLGNSWNLGGLETPDIGGSIGQSLKINPVEATYEAICNTLPNTHYAIFQAFE